VLGEGSHKETQEGRKERSSKIRKKKNKKGKKGKKKGPGKKRRGEETKWPSSMKHTSDDCVVLAIKKVD